MATSRRLPVRQGAHRLKNGKECPWPPPLPFNAATSSITVVEHAQTDAWSHEGKVLSLDH